LIHLGGADLTIGIEEMGKVLRRRWLFICSIVLGMILVAGGLSFYVIKPVYQASATLLVQSHPSGNQIAYNDLITNQNLVKTYIDIFQSRKITEDVIQRLQLDVSSEELLKKVKFNDSQESLVTGVSITDQSPDQAVAIANAFILSFKDNLNSIMQVDNVSILDQANLEDVQEPIRPKPLINLAIGLVLGLFVGVVSAFLLELLNQKINSEQDLEERLGILPLGTVTSMNKKLMKKGGLISDFNFHSPVYEAYRSIRTNLQYDERTKSLKTLLVTSAYEMEGKSLTVSNLAITIAQAGKRVLIIDGDMRKPSIHKKFSIDNNRGLSDVLKNHIPSLKEVASNVREGLDIVTAGGYIHNPSELISLRDFSKVLAEVEDDYDFILVDSPPLLYVPDAQIYATAVEGVLLVVRAGKVLPNQVTKTKSLLERVGANVVGAVLNDKHRKDLEDYSYYGPKTTKRGEYGTNSH
jgi:polysaccharide biosynthesis transport protein